MSARVIGGPSHWRANLDELTIGTAQLRRATNDTMRLAGEATVAGGMLSGLTIMTPQGAMIGANTLAVSAGLVTLRAEIEVLSRGVQFAVAAYLEAETQVTTMVSLAMAPTAVVLSLIGATTSVNVPNDVYALAIQGTTAAVWTPVEAAFATLDQTVPGTKMVVGNTVGWMLGMDKSLWDIAPTQRTFGMLSYVLQLVGATQLAPYSVDNVTVEAAADGWQPRDTLGTAGATQAMGLLQEYAYEADTITIAKIGQPDGTEAYAVMYAGTTPLGDDSGPLGLLGQEAAFGATGVVESVAAESVYVEAATLEILEQAGVPAGATIIPMGYSQGGTHAVNIAMSPAVNTKYAVSDVLTVAAPTGQRRTDALDTNYVHIEHEHDKVTALTGAMNEGRLNRTTIEVQGYPEGDIQGGVFGPEHNFAVINEQLAAALDDPDVARATEVPLHKIEEKMLGPVAVQQFALTRQSPPPPTNPFRVPHAALKTQEPVNQQRPISIRPITEWLTGTAGRPVG